MYYAHDVGISGFDPHLPRTLRSAFVFIWVIGSGLLVLVMNSWSFWIGCALSNPSLTAFHLLVTLR